MTPKFIFLKDVEAETVKWIWSERIPSAMLTLLVGIEGNGKTFTALDIAARITTGRPWPDAQSPYDTPEIGNVIFLTSEDHLSYTIKPRLDAMEADTARIATLTGVATEEGEEFFDVTSHLPGT